MPQIFVAVEYVLENEMLLSVAPNQILVQKKGKHNGAHSHTSAQRLWQDALQAWWTHKNEYTEAWGKVIGIFGAINQVRKDLHFGCKTCSPGLEGEKTLK